MLKVMVRLWVSNFTWSKEEKVEGDESGNFQKFWFFLYFFLSLFLTTTLAYY